jgi:hypothetical protein
MLDGTGVARALRAACNDVEPCPHPVDERRVAHYFGAGYLNVETGARELCDGCGHDFGAAS